MLNEDYADEAFITSPQSAVSDSPLTPHALEEELQDGGDSPLTPHTHPQDPLPDM